MGAAAAESGMDATWGRGCGEPRGGREGPAYIRAADPEEEGLADGPCTASASWGWAGVAQGPWLHLRGSEAEQLDLGLGSNVTPVLGS